MNPSADVSLPLIDANTSDRILVTTDFTEPSFEAVRNAVEFAKQFGLFGGNKYWLKVSA